jgi:plasmid stabilization system protein ParE
MANKVVWSLRARYDFFHLLETIAIDSQKQADIVGERFLARIALLPNRLSQGRKISEQSLKSSYRQVLVYQWRVIYLGKDGDAEIVAIIHSSRNLKQFIKTSK